MEEHGQKEDFLRLLIRTARGDVASRLYQSPGATVATIFVGGVGGGFDSPANGLYVRIARRLSVGGISSLRVRYRHPTILEEAAHDVLAGIESLSGRGISRVGLVGHSFGGAVVILAGASSPVVETVVALSSQSYGTEEAPNLAPRPLLLVHGAEDRVLPPACSVYIYELARLPKELRLIPNAGHGLDEGADEVFSLTSDWLIEHLAGDPAPS